MIKKYGLVNYFFILLFSIPLQSIVLVPIASSSGKEKSEISNLGQLRPKINHSKEVVHKLKDQRRDLQMRKKYYLAWQRRTGELAAIGPYTIFWAANNILSNPSAFYSSLFYYVTPMTLFGLSRYLNNTFQDLLCRIDEKDSDLANLQSILEEIPNIIEITQRCLVEKGKDIPEAMSTLRDFLEKTVNGDKNGLRSFFIDVDGHCKKRSLSKGIKKFNVVSEDKQNPALIVIFCGLIFSVEDMYAGNYQDFTVGTELSALSSFTGKSVDLLSYEKFFEGCTKRSIELGERWDLNGESYQDLIEQAGKELCRFIDQINSDQYFHEMKYY